MADAIIKTFLARPPYYGKSAFADKEAVKQLCGSTCCYDQVRKLWGTKCDEALRNLISSRKWQPYGIEYEWNARLARAAQEHREQAEAGWIAQQAAAAAARETATATLSDGVAGKSPATWLTAKSAPTSTLRAKATTGRVGAGVPPSLQEVRECARLGFGADAIALADSLNELGPRGTLSNEGRILRWCIALTSGAREYLYSGTDDPYDFYHGLEDDDRGPRGTDAFFDTERLASLSRRAHARFAERLAKKCRGEDVSLQ